MIITETVSPAYLLLKTRQLGIPEDLKAAEKSDRGSPESDSAAKFVNPRNAKGFKLSCHKLRSDKDERYAKELRSIYRNLNQVAAQLDALLTTKKPKKPKVNSPNLLVLSCAWNGVFFLTGAQDLFQNRCVQDHDSYHTFRSVGLCD